MGVNNVKERNTFRDCILTGLKMSGIRVSRKKPYSNDDLALVLRRFELPMDISYAIKSMYHGYLYHTGVMWNGIVYSYMPPMDNLLCADLSESMHLDSLKFFKSVGDTEIYYICNTGMERDQIKTRLIYMMKIANGDITLDQFNNTYGTGLAPRYNIFINNCEHITMSIIVGKNFSCQGEKVDPDIRKYKGLLKQYRSEMPDFCKVWIDEYFQVTGY